MKAQNLGLAAALLFGSSVSVLAQDGPAGKDREMQAPAARQDSGGGDGSSAQREDKGAPAESRGAGKDERGKSAEKASDQPPTNKGQGGEKQAREGKGPDQKQKDATSSKDNDTQKKGNTTGDANQKTAEPKESQASKDDTSSKSDTSKKAESPDTTNKNAESQDVDSTKKAESDDRKDAEKAKQVKLTGDKGDKVRTAFRGVSDVKHETNINVDISVGTRLPRSLGFRPVPLAVVEIVPEYRDYVFVYVDDRYVICEPDTYEVVAVLDASGGGQTYASGGGGGGGKCTTSLTLNDDERDLIIRSIQIADEEDVSGVTIGWSVPSSVELRTFPDPVLSRYGKLSGCRYFVVNDQIALVDPDEDKVVLLLEARD